MKLAALAVLLATAMQPTEPAPVVDDVAPMTVERTDLFTIRVEGVTYASITPRPEYATIGTQMMADYLAFNDTGVVEWRIKPDIEYRVVMTNNENDPARREVAVVSMREDHLLQYALWEIYDKRRYIIEELQPDFFEIHDAMKALRDGGHIDQTMRATP